MMRATETKKFIQEVFQNVIEDMEATEETYARYFSKNYIQYVDGKTLDYQNFIAHMKVQKAVMKSIKITFQYILAEDDKIATIHIAQGVKKDDTTIKMQVNALFKIKDEKIVLCNELTHLIQGEKSDEDMGSRY